MSFLLRQALDFARHNEEVRQVWAAYRARQPSRVPLTLAGSITNYLLNPELNVNGWSFQQFFEDPEIQLKAQLEYQKWRRFNLLCDENMGLPQEGWSLGVNFQNSYDAGWAGCPIRYFEGQLPDTEPILAEKKERLYELPAEINENNGLLGRGLEFFDYLTEKCVNYEFQGKPVNPPTGFLGEGTDGPLDLAYKLRGADNLLIDMLTDERYYHDLLAYVTNNLIHRMKRLRERRWLKFPNSPDKGIYRKPGFFFADDAIALISTAHYREFVYPYHKRFFDEFSDGSPAGMHLCGNATRHFLFLRQAFNVMSFDTGFPVDHGKLRAELGPEVEICGGPTVMVVKEGKAAEIESEVKRICQSGALAGGRFIMIAANNLAPCTPVENIQTLYEATKRYGKIVT